MRGGLAKLWHSGRVSHGTVRHDRFSELMLELRLKKVPYRVIRGGREGHYNLKLAT